MVLQLNKVGWIIIQLPASAVLIRGQLFILHERGDCIGYGITEIFPYTRAICDFVRMALNLCYEK